jgi:hypothetical protein
MEVRPKHVSVVVWLPLGKTITTFRLGNSHELRQVFDVELVWYLSQWFGAGQSGSHLEARTNAALYRLHSTVGTLFSLLMPLLTLPQKLPAAIPLIQLLFRDASDSVVTCPSVS